MNLLAIDCSANLCAACVWDTERKAERGRCVLDLGKGHAERLMATIAEALERAGIGYADLSAVAVSVGPGSFTGVRVGVSTARGLALALKAPAIGVTTLDAIAAETAKGFPGERVMVALEAGRGDLYAAVYDALGKIVYGPGVIGLDKAMALAQQYAPVLAGSAAPSLGARPGKTGPAIATADIATYARLAAGRGPGPDKPKPLYLREPDAKPQAGFVLPRRQS